LRKSLIVLNVVTMETVILVDMKEMVVEVVVVEVVEVEVVAVQEHRPHVLSLNCLGTQIQQEL
jgi:hypothetical protein